jgi:hypothetical protein
MRLGFTIGKFSRTSSDKSPGKSSRKSSGKRWGLRSLRPHWGVRGSLFAAFAVIAAMTIAISGCAGFVLRNLGSTMEDLSGRNIPRLATSL